MFCPMCGKETPDRATFCPACGAKLTSAKKERNPKSKSRTILPIVLIIVLLAVSFGVYKMIKVRAGKGQTTATLIPYRKGNKWGFCDRIHGVLC